MKEALRHAAITKPNNITDSEVVARVLTGDKQLYELLMRRHNQKLFRVIRSYLKNKREAEDAMQDTYLKAFEKLYQFRYEAQFSTWLIRIGINVALGKLRRDKRLTTANTDLADYNVLPTSETLPMDPERLIIRKEAKHLLEKAIDAIPDKYKIVYILRELEEMGVHEVMECLHLSESNVKVRLHRAKSLLKENLYELSDNKQVFEFGSYRCDSVVNRVIKTIS